MIVTSCPLRISLVGGSTDHPQFIEKFGHGSVISFPSNLRTYVSIHQDIFGSNAIEHKYNILYSKRESVNSINEIQNELVRRCFEHLDVSQLNCSLTSDIFSVGSGLAASSSYLQALIKSIYVLKQKNISEFEVCKIAEKIEKTFNPLVGQQDFYGSMGGFKRIDFYKDKDPTFKYLPTEIFDYMDMYLIYTGVIRSSTQILETLSIDKSLPLLEDVKNLEEAIFAKDIASFNEIINNAWEKKKQTSNLICNSSINELDEKLKGSKKILSRKLCGAGGGGYFLFFTNKDEDMSDLLHTSKITISETGLKYINLRNEFTKV